MTGLGAAEVFTLAVLGVAGVIDLYYRDIEPLYWIYSIPAGAIIYINSMGSVLEDSPWILLVLALVPAVLTLILYMAGVMGGADFMALLFLGASYPLSSSSILPIPLQAVLYAGVFSAVHRIYVSARVCGFRCIFRGRYRITIHELLTDPRFRWWIVATTPGGGDVGADPLETVLRLARSGVEVLEASPGIPYVFHIFLGTLTAMIVGDEPFRALVSLLA
ncbi:MAG: hypothetical protein GSR86_06870 [Desulfurococcales archaeon]|nr:hypothetical protein [Desulfurococcales archaeon]